MELISRLRTATAMCMTMLTALILTMLPVSAAESVIIPVEFNTESNEAFTVAVLGDGNCVSAATPSECASGVAFNCTDSTGICSWVGAKGISTGTAQDPATANQAIFRITNDGTATLSLTMESQDDITTTDSALNMTYTTEQEASCVTTDYGVDNFTGTLKDSAVTIDSSFTPGETQHCVWLFGNFSGASAGIDSTFIYLNSTVV